MKRVKMFVMANFILPLHSQSMSGSKPPTKIINVKETLSLLETIPKQESSKENKAVPVKKPKASKEDEQLFNTLINSEAEKSKKAINAQSLNEMLAEGRKENQSLLLIKNTSECNMVMEIEGGNKYQLPIPANNQNAVLLPKGIYQLKGNVCELRYENQKDLNKNILVVIKRIED